MEIHRHILYYSRFTVSTQQLRETILVCIKNLTTFRFNIHYKKRMVLNTFWLNAAVRLNLVGSYHRDRINTIKHINFKDFVCNILVEL